MSRRRPTAALRDPAEVLDEAWRRYRRRVEAAVRFSGRSDLPGLRVLLHRHAAELKGLVASTLDR